MISVLLRDLRRKWLTKGVRRCAAAIFLCGAASLPAAATEFALAPGQTVVGDVQRYVTRQGDVFADIARRFDVGYTELVAANPGIDPWVPGAGHTLTIPSRYILPAVPHQGIVVDLGQYRLFYFPQGDHVVTYPIGIGVIGWNTPLGVTRVVRKEPNPVWIPPASIRAQHAAEGDILPAVVPAGPDNPLGLFALRLGWKNYLIHGTNKPDGVGRNVSHGCIHLYPEDIAELFAAVSVGMPVRAVDEPAAAGWVGDRLYLSVHPSQAQVQQIDLDKRVSSDTAQGVRGLVTAVAGQYAGDVDWRAVDVAAAERTGMPVRIADRSGYGAQADDADGSALTPPSDDRAPQRYGDDSAGTYPAYPAAAYGEDAASAYDPGSDRASAGLPGYSADSPDQSYDRAMQSYDRARPAYRSDANQWDDPDSDQ